MANALVQASLTNLKRQHFSHEGARSWFVLILFLCRPSVYLAPHFAVDSDAVKGGVVWLDFFFGSGDRRADYELLQDLCSQLPCQMQQWRIAQTQKVWLPMVRLYRLIQGL